MDLDTLQSRRKIQQATFVAKFLNNELDALVLLTRIEFIAPSGELRSSNLETTGPCTVFMNLRRHAFVLSHLSKNCLNLEMVPRVLSV